MLLASHTLGSPSAWGILALLTSERVYELNLLQGERQEIQLLIIID